MLRELYSFSHLLALLMSSFDLSIDLDLSRKHELFDMCIGVGIGIGFILTEFSRAPL